MANKYNFNGFVTGKGVFDIYLRDNRGSMRYMQTVSKQTATQAVATGQRLLNINAGYKDYVVKPTYHQY